MMKRSALAGVALAVALAASLAPAAAAQAQPQPARPLTSGYLFVLRAASGQFERVPCTRRTFELVLRRSEGDVTWFTDRPGRRVGQQTLDSFVQGWSRLGFTRVPPNAALVIEDAPRSRDVIVAALSRPRLRSDGTTVAFRARVHSGNPGGLLRDLARRADRRIAKRFSRVSLFVDPGTQETVLTYVFTGLRSFDQVAVECPSAPVDTAEGVVPLRLIINGAGAADVQASARGFSFKIGDIGDRQVNAVIAVPVKIDDDIVRLRCTALFPPWSNPSVTPRTSGKALDLQLGTHLYSLT